MRNYEEENKRLGVLIDRYKEERKESDFEKIFKSTHDHLEAYMRAKVGENDLTDEAIQNSFIIFYQNPEKVTTSAAFIGWMQTTCYREYLAIVKKMHLNDTVAYDDSIGEDIEPQKEGIHAGAVDDTIFFPGEELAQKELTDLLIDAMKELPTLQKQAIYSFYYDGRSIKEIAEDISVPENTVKSYLSRGKKAMNKRISSYAGSRGLRMAPIALIPFVASLCSKEVQACEATITPEMTDAAYTAFKLAAGKAAIGTVAVETGSAASGKAAAAGAASQALGVKVAAVVTTVAIAGSGAAFVAHNQTTEPTTETAATEVSVQEELTAETTAEAEPEEIKADYSLFKSVTADLSEDDYRFFDMDGDGTMELFVNLSGDDYNAVTIGEYTVECSSISGSEFEIYALADGEVSDLGTYNIYYKDESGLTGERKYSLEKFVSHIEERIEWAKENNGRISTQDGRGADVSNLGTDGAAIDSSCNAAAAILSYPLLMKKDGSGLVGYTYSGGKVTQNMTLTWPSFAGVIDGTVTNTVTGESVSAETGFMAIQSDTFNSIFINEPAGYPE